MIAAPKKGSAKASILSEVIPNCRISSTGVRIPIISGANTYIITPIKAITPIPNPTVM